MASAKKSQAAKPTAAKAKKSKTPAPATPKAKPAAGRSTKTLPKNGAQLMAAIEEAQEGWVAKKRKGKDAAFQEIFDSIELTLRAFDIDLKKARECADWYRFTLDGNRYQAGRKGEQIVIYGELCATSAKVDPAKLAAAAKGNKAYFRESDGYICAAQERGLEAMSDIAFPSMLLSCRDALASTSAAEVRAQYK